MVPSTRFSARGLFPPLLLVAVGVLTYWNSFGGAFVFDDFSDIIENPSIHRLGTSWQPTGGAWRPVSWLTLAVNYALGKETVWGYHAVNLAIHILAALTLYGLVRGTLLLERYRGRWESSAPWLALAVAILWMVHPLHTETVTYIVHRYEALMGLFYLLTLYCVLRSAAPEARRRWWHAAAVGCCALGMGSKEVMVTAPLLVLLFDRVFLSGSWALVLRRWPLYAGLALTWTILAMPVAAVVKSEVSWAGFRIPEASPLDYAKTQPRVLLHYLQMTFWPSALCVDYRWPVSRKWEEVLPPLLVILFLLLGTLYALYRCPWLGFLSAAFFVILAPTSSFLPLADLAAERRTYLSVAAVAVLAVLAGQALLQKLYVHSEPGESQRAWLLGAGMAAALVMALASATIQRNQLYHDPEDLWRDALARNSENDRAHHHLGLVLLEKGKTTDRQKLDEAVEHFKQAIQLGRSPRSRADGHINLGLAYVELGRLDDARASFQTAIQLSPDFAAYYNLGSIYLSQGRPTEAAENYSQALALWPRSSQGRLKLGKALLTDGKLDLALPQFIQAVELDPKAAEAHDQLGNVYLRLGRAEEAAASYRRAVALKPEHILYRLNLAEAFHQQGDAGAAREQYREASRIDPDWPREVREAAWTLATHPNLKMRNGTQALLLAEHALQGMNKREARLLDVLAAAYAENGRFDEALTIAREALTLAQSTGQTKLAGQMQQRLQLYQINQPFRDFSPDF